MMFWSSGHRQRRSPICMIAPAARRGWAPPFRASVGCLPLSRRECPVTASSPSRVTHTGRRLGRCPVGHLLSAWLHLPSLSGVRYDGDLSGHRPQAASPRTGHGHEHHSGVLASCHEAPVAVTPPHWRLPTAVLDACGVGCASQWHRAAALRGLALGPGACAERHVGHGCRLWSSPPVGVAPRRSMLRGQAQAWPQCSGGLQPGAVPRLLSG